jgi:hypothetical protein
MPNECNLDGTMRAYNNDVMKIAKAKVSEIAQATA